MNIQLWKQGDPRWADDILGDNTDPDWNLAKVGCLVSDEAMLVATVTGDLSWTPAKMNVFLRANGGYDGGLLRWLIISKVFPFLQDGGKQSGPGWLDNLNAWIKDKDNYAILEVDNGVHYVLLYQTGVIADPIDGKSKKWNTTGYNYTSARFYRFVGGKGGGQNVPVLNNSGVSQVYLDQAVYQDLIDRKKDWELVSVQLIDAQAKLAAALKDADAWKTVAQIKAAKIQTVAAVQAAPDGAIATGTVPSLLNEPDGNTYRLLDAITATDKLHSASAQTYGVFKKLSVWFKKLVLK